jgi:O-antigen/teichoic acid export membrane protein
MFAGTSEVGLYQVGSSMAAVMALITNSFQQAWGPFALSIHRDDDAKKVYAKVLVVYAWVATVACVGLTLFSSEVIRLVATSRYEGAARVVGLLAFANIMMGFYYIAAIGLNICKQTKPIGIAITVAAALNVALNLLLVPRWGLVGSAVATLLSQVPLPVFLFYSAQRMYPVPYRFLTVAGILGTGVGVAVLGLWRGECSTARCILGKLLLVGVLVPWVLAVRKA